jgi:hypothetical protein
MRTGYGKHRTAVSAVAAIGAPAGNELLATKAARATTTISSSDLNVDFVDEHGELSAFSLQLSASATCS